MPTRPDLHPMFHTDDRTPRAVPTIVGVAHHRKGGAVVVAPNDRAYFVQGLSHWPDDVLGQSVELMGRIERRAHLPSATQAPDGSWSQGVPTGSSQEWVVLDATWVLQSSASVVPPPPWRVRYADGSGNVTRSWRTAPGDSAQWKYAPVVPQMSSSGTYSGGDPASGVLSRAQEVELWRILRILEDTPALHATERRKGTGALYILSSGAQRTLLARRSDTLSALEDWRTTLRADGPPPLLST